MKSPATSEKIAPMVSVELSDLKRNPAYYLAHMMQGTGIRLETTPTDFQELASIQGFSVLYQHGMGVDGFFERAIEEEEMLSLPILTGVLTFEIASRMESGRLTLELNNPQFHSTQQEWITAAVDLHQAFLGEGAQRIELTSFESGDLPQGEEIGALIKKIWEQISLEIMFVMEDRANDGFQDTADEFRWGQLKKRELVDQLPSDPDNMIAEEPNFEIATAWAVPYVNEEGGVEVLVVDVDQLPEDSMSASTPPLEIIGDPDSGKLYLLIPQGVTWTAESAQQAITALESFPFKAPKAPEDEWTN